MFRIKTLCPKLFAILAASCALQAQQGAVDPIETMVGRLDLEKYKATIKGLTKFGDRRQGTERNRQALDWIGAKLKSYGCSNIKRPKFNYDPPATPATPNP